MEEGTIRCHLLLRVYIHVPYHPHSSYTLIQWHFKDVSCWILSNIQCDDPYQRLHSINGDYKYPFSKMRNPAMRIWKMQQDENKCEDAME